MQIPPNLVTKNLASRNKIWSLWYHFFQGDLAAAIDRDFGSFAAMKEKLSAATVAVQVCNKTHLIELKGLF